MNGSMNISLLEQLSEHKKELMQKEIIDYYKSQIECCINRYSDYISFASNSMKDKEHYKEMIEDLEVILNQGNELEGAILSFFFEDEGYYKKE